MSTKDRSMEAYRVDRGIKLLDKLEPLWLDILVKRNSLDMTKQVYLDDLDVGSMGDCPLAKIYGTFDNGYIQLRSDTFRYEKPQREWCITYGFWPDLGTMRFGEENEEYLHRLNDAWVRRITLRLKQKAQKEKEKDDKQVQE